MVQLNGDVAQAEVVYNYRRAEYTVSTDQRRLNLDVIHGYLHRSYWSPGVPRETVTRAVRNSLSFGLYCGDEQIGFARVVTDYASVAYLADVFVLAAHRGQGLASWLIQCVVDCPALDTVRTLLLSTRDAHALYRKVGFESLSQPEHWMLLRRKPAWHQLALISE
jgi:GNAT superfamily N-acetyltransferase